MRTTRFLNNLHQLCSSQKIGKLNNLEAFGAEISKGLNRIAKNRFDHFITIHYCSSNNNTCFFRVFFSGQQI